MLRCKPGQMAKIIAADRSDLIGTIVTVNALGADGILDHRWGKCWWCSPAWPVKSAHWSTRKAPPSSEQTLIPDMDLEPIIPPEQPETVTTDEVATA